MSTAYFIHNIGAKSEEIGQRYFGGQTVGQCFSWKIPPHRIIGGQFPNTWVEDEKGRQMTVQQFFEMEIPWGKVNWKKARDYQA